MEHAVLGHFQSPLQAFEVFRSLPDIVAGHCKEYQQRCEEDNLLTTPGIRGAEEAAGLTGALIIVGLVRLFDFY